VSGGEVDVAKLASPE
jgi:hypothetical protein